MNESLPIDSQARFGMIDGHKIEEFASAMYRSAFCSCGWRDKINRRGNAWAQTSTLRKKEREHLRAHIKSSQG